MSKTKKLVLLTAAAAAAYWYYKHNQKDNSANTGSASSPQGVQYYRSKNGRIYYRDENHQAHWVTPPRQVYVPESEAPRYRQQADDFAYYQ